MERGGSVQILFHALLEMTKGAESKSVNNSSRHARSINTFLIALSQETSLHCFSMMLKQYTKNRSGEHNLYHHNPRSFTCQSQGPECLSHFYKHGENPQRICDWKKDSESHLLALERLLKQIWRVRHDSERKAVGPFCTTMSLSTLTWQRSTPWQTVTWWRPATHHIHMTSHQ